jgi:AcrR family transcriptional regulator
MDAATKLIVEEGFDETTLDAIAEEADVVQRTFYNHFDNKLDCVMAAIKQRFRNYAAEIIASVSNDEDPAKVFAAVAMEVFDKIASDPVTKQLAHHPRILIDAVGESQQEFFIQDLARGLELGRFKPSMPPEVLEPIINWGFVGLIIKTIESEDPVDRKAAWAYFVLEHLGIQEEKIHELIEGVNITSS